MRLFVCGVDAEGRSCVLSQNEIAFGPVPGLPHSGMAKLFGTDQSPPPSSPPGLGSFAGDSLKPGHVSWYIMDHKPQASAEEHAGNKMHYRNAVDMVFVLEGTATMLLGDGAHPIEAGDCLVMPGSDHGLKAGPDGCRLMAFAIGTPPAA
jgi:hypothetical protein